MLKVLKRNWDYIEELYNAPGFDKTVIEMRYAIFQFDDTGFTPLHWAVKLGNLDMIKMLIENRIGHTNKKVTIIPEVGDNFEIVYGFSGCAH